MVIKYGSAPEKFSSTWDTTQAGSANNTVVLPLVSDGAYLCTVDWGDGKVNRVNITGHDQSEVTHQYENTGVYNITIAAHVGDLNGWVFNNSGDDDKITKINEWGPLRFVSSDINLFKGCASLTLSTTNDPPFNANVESMFHDCTSLSGTGGNILNWDMSSVTGMNFMLAGCTSLDVDLSNWDVSAIKNASGFMQGCTLSTSNYDRILSGWSSQPVQSGVTISFGSTKFSQATGLTYKNVLVASGWTISDGGAVLPPPQGFISTWNTTLAGSANDTVVLPLYSAGSYDFYVNWGDGNEDNITSYNQSEVTHQYSSTGIYTISITGGITGWQFASAGDDDKITNISQWGPLTIKNDQAFNGCSVLDISTTDSLKLINAPSFIWGSRLLAHFNGIKSMTGCDLSSWDISELTNMRGFFFGAGNANNSGLFDADLSNWDVSSVTGMPYMFTQTQFSNGGSPNISGWDVSSVKDMDNMFSTQRRYNPNAAINFATGFNQPIGSWDVSNVEKFTQMFGYNQWFDQDIGNWDLSSATNTDNMFAGSVGGNNYTAFNNGGSPSISGWDMSNVTQAGAMFQANSGFNQPIGSWDVSNISNLGSMFANASGFDQDLGSWDVTSASYMVDFMKGITLSTANYNSILIGWAPQSVQNGVSVSFGNSKYSAGAAATARSTLVGKGWTITDGGQV